MIVCAVYMKLIFFIPDWSHYMLLEWYLPYIVKYGPGGNELPKSYGDALKYLRENYIVQSNQNEVTDQ